MKSTEITIALPTNSRITADISPFREALRLEGKQGVYRSSDFKNARFRDLRAQDIARLLTLGLLNMGVTGRDIMLEKLFEIVAPVRDSIFEICEIRSGKPAKMALLGRSEDSSYGILGDRFRPNGSLIVTSYPELTKAAVLDGLKKYLSCRLTIQTADGKIESLVRNQDFGPTVGGVDLVRSGDSAREYKLFPIGDGPILESWPTLYRTANLGNEINLVADATQFLREKITEAGFSLGDGAGFDFRKKLCPWKMPSGPVEELT